MKHLRRAIQRLIRRAHSKRAAVVIPRPLRTGLDGVVNRLPKTHQAAAQALADWPVIESIDYRNAVVKTSRELAHPEIVEFYLEFNKVLRARGYPFYAFEFHRSLRRQHTLYQRGVSKAKPGESPHNYGCAVDIVHLTRKWDLTRVEWAVVGALGKEVARRRNLKIDWGGDWRFYDPAHWQLTNWKEIGHGQVAARRAQALH